MFDYIVDDEKVINLYIELTTGIKPVTIPLATPDGASMGKVMPFGSGARK